MDLVNAGHLAELYYKCAQKNLDYQSFIDLFREAETELCQEVVDEARKFLESTSMVSVGNEELLNETIQSAGSKLFGLLKKIGYAIDILRINHKEFPLYSPHLLMIFVAVEFDAQVNWNSRGIRDLMKYLMLIRDGGPIPFFDKIEVTYEKDRRMLENLQASIRSSGRNLVHYSLVIDHSCGTKKIKELLERMLLEIGTDVYKENGKLKVERHSEDDLRNKSYWSGIELHSYVETLCDLKVWNLFTSVSSDLQDDLSEYVNRFPEETDLFEQLSSEKAKNLKHAGRSLAAKWARRNRDAIERNGQDTEGKIKERGSHLMAIVHLIRTGFNLPVGFTSAEESAHAIRNIELDLIGD